MNHNSIGWFEIYVQDMERARAFYEQVFATQLSRIDQSELELWAFPMDNERYGATGALVRMEGMPSGANSVLVYFMCDDCAVEAGRVEAAGGRIHKPKFSIGPYGHIALVVDTEGNMIGLHSQH